MEPNRPLSDLLDPTVVPDDLLIALSEDCCDGRSGDPTGELHAVDCYLSD